MKNLKVTQMLKNTVSEHTNAMEQDNKHYVKANINMPVLSERTVEIFSLYICFLLNYILKCPKLHRFFQNFSG